MLEKVANKVFVQSGEVVACQLDGGMALLDMRSSNYYRLNFTASLIWEWIGEGADIQSLVTKMVSEFEVGYELCSSDVIATVAAFYEAGLVESTD